MNVWSIPRGILIIIGVVGLVLGVFIGFLQISLMFSAEGYYTYSTLYPNTLSGAAQEMSILLTNMWLAINGIMAGLIFLSPVKIGRFFRAAGYTTPNTEVIPKAYRLGGIEMIVAGVLSVIARLFFSNVDISLVMIVPVLMLIFGVVGLLASFAKVK